jgi:hypothetical protein
LTRARKSANDCGLDTLGMIQIVDQLKRLAYPSSLHAADMDARMEEIF